MTAYFAGRRRVGRFFQTLDSGRSRVDVDIYERWEDIDASTTARCGAAGSCQIAKSEGLSEKSAYNLKGVIESTLGTAGVLSLKVQVEETIGREVNWNRGVTVTKTFPYTAPKCGRFTLTIYELTREYEIAYSRLKRRLFHPDVWETRWTKTLHEATNRHDGYPDIEEFDEACGCPGASPQSDDGRLSFDFGSLTFRFPYRLTESGFEVQIFKQVVAFAFATGYANGIRSLDAGVTIDVPLDVIPEPLLFLGELHGERANATVTRWFESLASALPVPDLLPAAAESIRISGMAALPEPKGS